MPPLDRTVRSFELTTGAGKRVALDQLVRRGPVVLVLLGEPAEQPDRIEMVRHMAAESYAWGARLALVTPGDDPLAAELAAAHTATWLVDRDAVAFACFDLCRPRRFGRARLESGVFVIDSKRTLRLSYVAPNGSDWVPAAVVISRLKRLGAYEQASAEHPAEDAAEDSIDGLDQREQLVRAVARGLGLEARSVAEIATASRLADAGMATVPDEIIHKDGPLNDEEWALIREHPLRSAEMLPAGTGVGVREIISASHEHLDGSGYPRGLAGERIPLGARVLLVVEAYLAMTHARTYRALLGMRDALDELRDAAGTLYDPAVVAALERAVTRRSGATARFR